MRTESIHEKCLLSRVLTYSSDITVLDSSFFSPVPIPSPCDELSIYIMYSPHHCELPNLYIPKVSL